MSFPYKRYIVIISNQDSKLSTLMAKWKNSYNFHTESLRNYPHYGTGFANSILLSLGLWVFKIARFWCKMVGCLRLFVTRIDDYLSY